MPVTPQITLTGTLDSLSGVAVNRGSLNVQLCGFGSAIPRVSGTALIVAAQPLNVSCPVGTFSFLLWGNDVIAPAGTFYTVQVLDEEMNVVQTNAYQFSGGPSSTDLSTVVPYLPSAATPNIVGGLVIVAYSSTAEFNCALISGLITFEMTVTGNLAAPTVTNAIPGQLVTFVFIQDGVGGRTITWPANVHNGTDLNPVAGGFTTQTFVVRSNGHLYPIGGGIWS